MPRLNVIAVEQANGQVRDLYAGLKAAIGAVPNIYRSVANSPAALDILLGMGAKLRAGGLSGAQTEAVKLVVSQIYGCSYCLAAHTLVGKKAGLSEADTLAIRRGTIADHRDPDGARTDGVYDPVQPREPDRAGFPGRARPVGNASRIDSAGEMPWQ